MVLIGAFTYLAGQVDYQVLFSGLSHEDAAAIVSKLQEKKISYKLSAAGDVIYAPADKVPELRMEMAAAGALRGGIVGYEIFDNKTLGATEFEQQLNFRRALQGELSRTINSLDEVEQSRVHIAFPKESLFVDQQKKATASVTIKLKAGKGLRPNQIDGIAYLVARSVEGLGPEDVIVVTTATSSRRIQAMARPHASRAPSWIISAISRRIWRRKFRPCWKMWWARGKRWCG